MHRILWRGALLPACAVLSACSPLSTFRDSQDTLSCGVPPGVHCTSLSENYGRVQASRKAPVPVTPAASGPLPPPVPAPAVPGSRAHNGGSQRSEVLQSSAVPARETERLVRIVVMPRTDSEGDLIGAQEVWMRLESSRWDLESARRDFFGGPEAQGWR